MKVELKKLFEGSPTSFFDAVRAKLEEKVETVIPYIAEELAESVFEEAYGFGFSDKARAKHKPLGAFTEKDHGHSFEYSHHDDEWAHSHGLKHRIKVGNGKAGPSEDVRYGNVKGTRAHVATDENADGTPKMETWHFKNHNKYTNEEVVQEEYTHWKDWNDDYVKLLKKRNQIEREHDKVTRMNAHLNPEKAKKLVVKLDAAKKAIEDHQNRKDRPSGHVMYNTTKS